MPQNITNKKTAKKESNQRISYTPNAYEELNRYLDRIKELQNSVNDKLGITRDDVRHLEVEVYCLQATT